MLILSRKPNESIEVTTLDGDTINLMITKINGSQVKVGVTAPADCSILRKELIEASSTL